MSSMSVQKPKRATRDMLTYRNAAAPDQPKANKAIKRTVTYISSTLYKPVEEDFPSLDLITDFCQIFGEKSRKLQFANIVPTQRSEIASMLCDTSFGLVPKGSVLSYQCPLITSSDMIQINDAPTFQNLPTVDRWPSYQTVLIQPEAEVYERYYITKEQVIEIEKNTQSQSENPEWKALRKYRITASTAFKRIYSRRGDHEKLALTF